MTAVAFRKMALAHAGAIEAPHFDRASFRVDKKIFATMTADGKEAMVRVFPTSRAYALIREQPEVFFSHGGWTERLGSVGVHLAAAKANELTPLVQASFDHATQKKKRRA